MRIAMLSWEALHSIPVGGLATHVTELAAALSRRGHEVHVFTRRQGWMSHYACIDGVHYHRCDFDFHPDFITKMHNMCRSFIWHLWQTEDYVGSFDLVHAHDWMASMGGMWAKWGRGKRFVLTMHATQYARCGNKHCDGSSGRVRHHEGEGILHADLVIAVSNALKWEITHIYNAPAWKIWSVPNAVSVHNFDGFINPGKVKARYGIDPWDPLSKTAGN